MKATGKTDIRHPVKYDPWRILEKSKPALIIDLPEYDTSIVIPMAEIAGRFTSDFCPSMHPTQMTENPNQPEIAPWLELHPSLIERLEKDGETKPEIVEYLKQFMESPVVEHKEPVNFGPIPPGRFRSEYK